MSLTTTQIQEVQNAYKLAKTLLFTLKGQFDDINNFWNGVESGSTAMVTQADFDAVPQLDGITVSELADLMFALNVIQGQLTTSFAPLSIGARRA